MSGGRTGTWLAAVILLLLALLGLRGCSGNGGGEDADVGVCKNPCLYWSDCGTNQDCVDGCCKISHPCSQNATCLPAGNCLEGRCVHLCLGDTGCPAEASCIDGMCQPYNQQVLGQLTAPPVDQGWTQLKALRVGIGDVPLDFPIGVSMAGYGGRNLLSNNPYGDSNGGSDSVWDRPRAKAFVFDNGLKRLVIVKAPMCWSDDFMASHVAWRLYQATQQNYLDRILFSAPHSHSEPGRFWNILKDKKIGVFGHGDFNFEIFGRHSKAIADAIQAGIDDLKPAKVGYAVNPAMDPDHKIHNDRRGEDQDPLDDSLVVIRIDDADGHPRGLLVNFALHGTQMKGDEITGDAPGAVEILAQQNLQQETGYPLKVAFLSGNSGDVSPAGDSSVPEDDNYRKTQEVGVQTYPKIKALFDSLEGQTSSDVDLDISNRRVAVNRQALGYGAGVFKDEDGNDYQYGAFQCVGQSKPAPDQYQDGHLGCIFSTELLADGHPIREFMMARMSVARIGKLGLVTLPGEPLGKYGRDTAQKLMDAGMEYATILGYSQDHHFYLMHADDWMHGGYEPSMDIWGWAEADYYSAKSAEMYQPFVAQGGSTDNGSLKPTWFEWQNDSVTPTDTASADAGKILGDVPAKAERLDTIHFMWMGGHPGVDLPRVTLERQDGSAWSAVTNAAGETYAADGFNLMTWYRGDYQNDHTWEVSWEEPEFIDPGLSFNRVDFPAGTYRLRVDGRYRQGSATLPYTALSGSFDFQPNSHLLLLGLGLDQNQVSGSVLYPPGPTNDNGVSAFSQLNPMYFLRHNSVTAPTFPWPVPSDGSVKVSVTLQPPSGAPVTLDNLPASAQTQVTYTFVSARDAKGVETKGQRTLPATGFSAAHGAYRGAGKYSITVTVRDAFGNTGTATSDFDLN